MKDSRSEALGRKASAVEALSGGRPVISRLVREVQHFSRMQRTAITATPWYSSAMDSAVTVETTVGWREDLGDHTPRVEAGASVGVGVVAFEMNGAVRFRAENAYSGQIAATHLFQNDAFNAIFRDDGGTAAAVMVLSPFGAHLTGPSIAVGVEGASTEYRLLGDGPGDSVDEAAFLTVGVLARAGIEASFGHVVGARATLSNRLNWLREPTFDGSTGEVEIVGEWRTGIDLVLRLR